MNAPDFPGVDLAPIARAAVIGAGTMGTGIASVFADARIPVQVVESSEDALRRARETLARLYDSRVERGRLTPQERDARVALVELGSSDDGLERADVAVEAVFESLALKREVFARLGERCRPDTLLATNTSTLDVDAIAAAAPFPQRSLGLHFFSPAYAMRLLEVVRGARTSDDTIARALALANRLGKIPVVVGNCDGFVGNRMLLPYRREAEMLVLGGATPAQVDAALERFGFALGPFAVADLAGVDVGWRAKHERVARGAAPPYTLTNLADRLVAAGRLGQKTSKGWYRYELGSRERFVDAEVDAIVGAERVARGITPRLVDDEEIVARCVYALINEGARILGDGIARSAEDVDTIWLNGYGFPAVRGGPMKYADDVGLAQVLAAIRRFAAADAEFWKPAALLVELVGSGGHFRR